MRKGRRGRKPRDGRFRDRIPAMTNTRGFGKVVTSIALALCLPLALACGPKKAPDGPAGDDDDDRTNGGEVSKIVPPEPDAGVVELPVVDAPPPPPPAPVADHTEAMGLFDKMCAGCHRGERRKGPAIEAGYYSRAWIRGFLQDPSGDGYFGKTKITKMKPVKQSGAELDALVELVYAEGGGEDADAALVATGTKLFDTAKCSNCHAADGTTEGEVGPNLGGHGSAAQIAAFLANPDSKLWFGGKNTMPKFNEKLTEDQRAKVAAYIVSLRDAE
jgi:mono/diheme cytochrome c family protein